MFKDLCQTLSGAELVKIEEIYKIGTCTHTHTQARDKTARTVYNL